jgi:hypothetical protein
VHQVVLDADLLTHNTGMAITPICEARPCGGVVLAKHRPDKFTVPTSFGAVEVQTVEQPR